MEVQSINHSSLNFGAKIKLENRELMRIAETQDKGWANTILNKFEAYHPEETVIVGTANHPVLGPVIYAKNLISGWIFNEKCGYNFEGKIGESKSFYKLLTDLLNQKLLEHNDFWVKNAAGYTEQMPKAKPGLKDMSPMLHNVFIDI